MFASPLLAKDPLDEKQEGEGKQEPKAKSHKTGTPIKPAPLAISGSEAPPPAMDVDAKGPGTKRALENDDGDIPKENGDASPSEKGEGLDELRLKYHEMAAKKANNILAGLREQQDAANVVVDESASEDL